jgi:hypothetical protein
MNIIKKFENFDQSKVDNILDKVSKSGIDSLSREEKEYLASTFGDDKNKNIEKTNIRYRVTIGEDPLKEESSFTGSGYQGDIENIDCSKDNPYTIGVLNWDGDGGEEIGINCYVEIYEPFTRYVDDEYDATEYIKFQDGKVYWCCWSTPMESQGFNKIDIDDFYFEDEDDRDKLRAFHRQLIEMKTSEIIG